jgi:uncharacterized protein YjiS (DUF1127 family)
MNLIESFRRWSAFRQTVDELNQLDDRSLADLGIARADISRLAHDHVYRG